MDNRNARKYFLVMACLLSALSGAQADDSFVRCNRLGRWTNCIATPLASAEQDALAKTFQAPVVGKAKIYLVRSSTIEPRTKSGISLDGAPVADLVPMTYLVLELEPGTHQLMARTDHEFGVTLDMVPGRLYFVQHRLRQLFGTVSGALKVVEEEDGQAEVRRSMLIYSKN